MDAFAQDASTSSVSSRKDSVLCKNDVIKSACTWCPSDVNNCDVMKATTTMIVRSGRGWPEATGRLTSWRIGREGYGDDDDCVQWMGMV